MSDPILIAIAWPYANAEIHVGNLTGSHLPGDIVARYHRLKGDRVLMVSGTDSHGTPVTIKADALQEPVESVYKQYHEGFLDLFRELGILYDLFTTTHTQNHFEVSQAIFRALHKNGFLYTETRPQWFSPSLNKFLPDRYVEGTCYICGYEGARSDQCDNCGNILEPDKLIDPRSKVGGALILRDTEHFFLDLSKMEPDVKEFLVTRQSYWRETVIGESLRKIQSEGLKARPITRDLDWGIPVPVEGWNGKCLYVWFEAVIGYLSAAIEWARIDGSPESWKNWWADARARTYYFIGKDNIFFHAAMWPAELMGAGEQFLEIYSGETGQALNLPYDVPANQFMNLEGRKISGSRNWAVWGRDFLTRYDPDPLRYYLTVNMPETRDSDWNWDDFFHRNNDELVATWGNLVNRVLSFAFRNWEGHIPDPGELRSDDRSLLATIEGGFAEISEEIEAVHLRTALNEVMRMASEVNKYLDVHAPWFEIKTDKDEAAKSIFTAIKAIDSLKILFAPFLPFTCERLHAILNYQAPLFGEQVTQTIEDNLGKHKVLRYHSGNACGKWEASHLKGGEPLQPPKPLFKKLDEKIVEEERARLGN